MDFEEDNTRVLNEILRRKQLILKEIEQLKNELRDANESIDQFEDVDLNKSVTVAKQLSAGKKNFNKNPKKGVTWLLETNVVENTAFGIADFLYRNSDKGLSKTAIGEYLGDNNDLNLRVLKEFVQLHDFTNKKLDDALRVFLWSFLLPGEAQKIDRMMESFAEWYVKCNPGVFSSTDTCYILSFATIMLNTSLHNPSVHVRDKPSKDAFIVMNRQIDDGKDLPSNILTSIYDNIKKHPFKVPEEDIDISQFYNPEREGWLMKQGGSRMKTWRRRWFILEDECLYYFEYTRDKEPKGIIPLENLQVREVADAKKPNCFEIFLPSDAMSDSIKIAKSDSEGKLFDGTKHMSYRFSAPTTEEKDLWISTIRKSISNDPYYDMIAARKKSVEERHKNS